MASLKLTFFALLLTYCFQSISSMGLCDFAEKFPCKDNEGSICFKNPGCTKTPIHIDMQTERTPITNQSQAPDQSTTDDSIHQPFMLNTSTTEHVVQTSKTVSDISTNYATSKQGSDNLATNPIPITALFTPNMTYARNTEGSSKTPIPKDMKDEWITTTNLSTTGHLSYEPISSKQDMLNTSATYQMLRSSEPVLKIFTDYKTIKQENNDRETTDHYISTTAPFSPNMVYAYSTEGQDSTKTPNLKDTKDEMDPTVYQSTTGHSTHEPLSSEKELLTTSSADQVHEASKPVLEMTTFYTTRKQENGNRATTEHSLFATHQLPSNMTNANRNEGQEYTKPPIVNDTPAERTSIINQSSPGYSTGVNFTSTQDVLHTSAVYQGVQVSKAVLEVSTNYKTTNKGSNNRATAKHPTSTTHQFPTSLMYHNNTKRQGYTKTSILYNTKAEINQTTNQSNTSFSTGELSSSHHDLPKYSTVNQLAHASEAVLEISTYYTISKEKNSNRATTEHSISTTTPVRTIMVYANSTEGQGYSNTPIRRVTQTEINPPTDQSTISHSTYEPLTSKQDMLETSATNKVTQTSEPVLQISTNILTTKQESYNHVTTDHPIPTTTPCPSNMVYAYCTEGQGTCQDPLGTTDTCSESMTCVCPHGFLMKGNDCVPQAECECYIDEFGIIPDGDIKVNADCTNRCECQSNVITCNPHYSCSSAATCEERDGVRQCYCNVGYAGDGQSCEVEATDCADLYNAGVTQSGVYTIKPTTWPWSPFQVYCNMTVGGGWTVFQRRVDGSQDFYKGWNMYKSGFGSPDRELWLGNDKLYYMTNSKDYKLRIDLTDKYGFSYYAKYDVFRISDANDKYRLVGLGTFSGNQGYDALNKHRNDPFSTYDRDNDDSVPYNCAKRHRGGWWYDFISFDDYPECTTGESDCDYWRAGLICGHCANSNLNGEYDSSTRGTSIHWTSLPGYDCNIIYAEMKIKPA